MKTKPILLVAIMALMAMFFGCKKSTCCVLPEETNTILALKSNVEWRTDGYLYKYNLTTDTAYIVGLKDQESLSIQIKRSGNTYAMMDANLSIVTGDILWADYVLDTSKNNTFATTASTAELLEGKFDLYFKINHNDASHPYPSTVVFKNGLFRIRWDHIPPVLRLNTAAKTPVQ